MTSLSRFTTLIRRELAEHRKSVLYAPLIVALVVCALILLSLISNGAFKVNNLAIGKPLLDKLSAQSAERLELFHQVWMLGFYVIFHIATGAVVIAYTLACLFDERRDRSTLFWRSMPVNDWESVLSKTIMAVLIIPTMYMLGLLLTQLAFYLLLVVLCWQNGLSASTLVFSVAPIVSNQLVQLSLIYASMLWALPVIGWFMLCSAYVKQRPFLVAWLVPGVIILALYLLNLPKLLSVALGGSNPIHMTIKEYGSRVLSLVFPSLDGFESKFRSVETESSMLSMSDVWVQILSLKGLLGVAVGAALIAAAAYVRRYREDTAS
jgi:ABC-2 type transport system permease protein